MQPSDDEIDSTWKVCSSQVESSCKCNDSISMKMEAMDWAPSFTCSSPQTQTEATSPYSIFAQLLGARKLLEANDLIPTAAHTEEQKQKLFKHRPKKHNQPQADAVAATLRLFNNLLNDPIALDLFSYNHVVKIFVFDLLADFIGLANPNNDEFNKELLTILYKVLRVDYDEKARHFVNDTLLPCYASLYLRVMPQLVDMALEESFFGGDEDPLTDFAETFVHLLIFAFRIFKIEELLRMNFNSRHLQFIIIHFTKSPKIPKLIDAISANLNDPSKLYSRDTKTNDYDVDISAFSSVYQIMVKSCDLLYRYYYKDAQGEPTLRRTYSNLATFAAKCLSNTTPLARFCEISTIHKSTGKILVCHRKKLSELTRENIMKHSLSFILNRLLIIESNISNVSSLDQTHHAKSIINSIVRIYESNWMKDPWHDDEPFEMERTCFSIAGKLVENTRENFVINHFKQIESIWLRAVQRQSVPACKALLQLLRVKHKSVFLFMSQVVHVIKDLFRTYQNEPVTLNVSMLSWLIISLTRYYSNFSPQAPDNGLNDIFVYIIDHHQQVLFKRHAISPFHLNQFLSFSTDLLNITTRQFAMNNSKGLVKNVIVVFEHIIQARFHFELTTNTHTLCFILFSSFVRTFSNDNRMQQFVSTFKELFDLINEQLGDGDNVQLQSEIALINKSLVDAKWI